MTRQASPAYEGRASFVPLFLHEQEKWEEKNPRPYSATSSRTARTMSCTCGTTAASSGGL